MNEKVLASVKLQRTQPDSLAMLLFNTAYIANQKDSFVQNSLISS